MKKYLLFLASLVLLPFMSACQDTAHSIIAIKNIDSDVYSIELSLDELQTLIDNKQQFVVEFYSPYCGHCQDLNELLVQYVKETNNIYYRFDASKMTLEEFAYFHSEYPSIFPNEYVPSIRFVKDGVLTYEVDNTKHESYKALKSIMNKHFLSSNVSITSSFDNITQYGKEHEERILFAYDITNPISIKIASDKIMTTSYSSKHNVLFMNKREMDSDLEIVKSIYQIDVDTFIVKVEKEKWIVGDYSTSSFNFDLFV